MRGVAKPDFRWNPRAAHAEPGSKPRGDPGLEIAYQIAAAVMDIAGPLFWAALVLAYITGALGINLFH
jgi:hypothetical protein